MVTEIEYCGRNLISHTDFIEGLREDPRYQVKEEYCIGKCEECPLMYILRAYEPTWIRGERYTSVAKEEELPAAFERTMRTRFTSRLARAAVQKWESRKR